MIIGEPRSQRSYACNCLNIKLRCTRSDQHPDLPTSPNYTPIYIERDEDIKIIFPHLTLRNRKRAPYIPDPAKTARYTSLTCLCCQTLVYRIHHIVSVDDEHNLKEGPIITKGWTETEVLRSISGWVEVFHSQVLTEDDIQKQERSSQFSQTFGIVITPLFQSTSSETVSGRSLTPKALPKYKLPPIPHIFPEPKSNTSLFATLASLAGRRSSDLRSAAEQYIDDIVKQKVEEIRFAENQLKKDVQSLLTKYNEGIKRAEQSSLSEQTSALRQREIPSPAHTETPPFSGKPVSVVREFVPSVLPHVRTPPANSPTPRLSTLSASLATQSFHHPRDRHHSPPQSPTQTPRSPMSLQSASSTTLFMQPSTSEIGNVHRWGRNTDEQLDISTSYIYFLNLEEEMERRKQALAGTSTSVGQSSQRLETSSTTERATNDKRKEEESIRKAGIEKAEQSNVPAIPSAKSKGKRKVTFDVKVNQPEASIQTLGRDEMLFDFEDENERRENDAPPVLPLIEQPSSRHPKSQRRNSKELPGLLSSLRPSSLPTPSYLPDILTNTLPLSVHDDAKPSFYQKSVEDQFDLTTPQTLPIPGRSKNGGNSTESSRTPREEEVLTKLAASMPSHRAAWRDNRGEFASFFSEKSDDWAGDDPEETTGTETAGKAIEATRQNDGFIGSLPVPIYRPNAKVSRPPLSLVSYQADGSLSTNHTVNNRRASFSPLDATEEHPGSEDSIRSDSTPTRDGSRSLPR